MPLWLNYYQKYMAGFLLHRTVMFIAILPLFFFGLAPQKANALSAFTIEESRTVYGAIKSVKAGRQYTLLDMAREYDLGYNQIVAANPRLDPWMPPEGADVLVPTIFVLPRERLSSGIVVNLAEMRLYYLKTIEGASARFWTCPVGVGREGYSTELSIYTVLSKVEDPIWVPPPSVRREDPDLPPQILPGPDNPLGKYILRFSRLSYGIHGTNRPWGVGRRVSHGCIRLYSEDIAELFQLVQKGTLVRIIYEPIKVGWAEGKCWLQVFEDYENRIDDPLGKALSCVSVCEQVLGPLKVNLKEIKKAVKERTGIPVPVAKADRE